VVEQYLGQSWQPSKRQSARHKRLIARKPRWFNNARDGGSAGLDPHVVDSQAPVDLHVPDSVVAAKIAVCPKINGA